MGYFQAHTLRQLKPNSQSGRQAKVTPLKVRRPGLEFIGLKAPPKQPHQSEIDSHPEVFSKRGIRLGLADPFSVARTAPIRASANGRNLPIGAPPRRPNRKLVWFTRRTVRQNQQPLQNSGRYFFSTAAFQPFRLELLAESGSQTTGRAKKDAWQRDAPCACNRKIHLRGRELAFWGSHLKRLPFSGH
jgi:hypothetical protein